MQHRTEKEHKQKKTMRIIGLGSRFWTTREMININREHNNALVYNLQPREYSITDGSAISRNPPPTTGNTEERSALTVRSPLTPLLFSSWCLLVFTHSPFLRFPSLFHALPNTPSRFHKRTELFLLTRLWSNKIPKTKAMTPLTHSCSSEKISTLKIQAFSSGWKNLISTKNLEIKILSRLNPGVGYHLLARGIRCSGCCSGGLRERIIRPRIGALHSSQLLSALLATASFFFLLYTFPRCLSNKNNNDKRRRRQPPEKKEGHTNEKFPFDFYAPERVPNCAKSLQNDGLTVKLAIGQLFATGSGRFQ